MPNCCYPLGKSQTSHIHKLNVLYFQNLQNHPFFSHTAKRPPVDETKNFLRTLLTNHGPNYLEKLFGSKARDALYPLGGVEKVAVALSGTYWYQFSI